jgi:hypothetical protein
VRAGRGGARDRLLVDQPERGKRLAGPLKFAEDPLDLTACTYFDMVPEDDDRIEVPQIE